MRMETMEKIEDLLDANETEFIKELLRRVLKSVLKNFWNTIFSSFFLCLAPLSLKWKTDFGTRRVWLRSKFLIKQYFH